ERDFYNFLVLILKHVKRILMIQLSLTLFEIESLINYFLKSNHHYLLHYISSSLIKSFISLGVILVFEFTISTTFFCLVRDISSFSKRRFCITLLNSLDSNVKFFIMTLPYI